MFGRPHDGIVGGVNIHRTTIFDITQHTGTLKQVNMITGIDNARHIVEILGC